MNKLVLSLSLAATAALAQYKIEPAGPPPSDLAPDIRAALQQGGAKISGPSGPYCQIWLRTSVPSANNGEQNVSFTQIAQGTLLGVIQFPGPAKDRRGQNLKPGVYTMRLSFYPVDGAHQGVAPTRDFLLLTPADADKDLNSTPAFQQLLDMSKKASGTQHPAVLNIWKPDSKEPTAVKQEGEDWVLYSAIGDNPIAIIVVGQYAG